jgi:hypothetical protein
LLTTVRVTTKPGACAPSRKATNQGEVAVPVCTLICCSTIGLPSGSTIANTSSALGSTAVPGVGLSIVMIGGLFGGESGSSA